MLKQERVTFSHKKRQCCINTALKYNNNLTFLLNGTFKAAT